MVAGTEFVLVDVYAVWPAIAARARRSRSDPDVLRDIRLRCLDGSAVCLQSPEGVVVLGARGTEAGGLVADVLLAVSAEGSLQGTFKRHEDAMLAIARDLGASELAFKTDRRGWTRLLGPQWSEHDGTFTRSVS